MIENWNFITATKEFNTFEKSVAAPYIRKSIFCEEAVMAKLQVAAFMSYL